MEVSLYETIDRLCEVTTMLADLVREQAAVIAQADIPDDVKAEFAKKRATADDELDIVEYAVRNFIA